MLKDTHMPISIDGTLNIYPRQNYEYNVIIGTSMKAADNYLLNIDNNKNKIWTS